MQEPSQPPLIVLGSARGSGNTAKVADRLREELGGDMIDLLDYTIYPYHYSGDYRTDDQYLEIIENYVLPRQHIILASPVYWYTMSGTMKHFVDRFSDLLTTHKGLGRQLRGKTLGVLSCAKDAEIIPTFFTPFRLTAEYLGMQYGPEYHGWCPPATPSAMLVRRLRGHD